LQVKFYKLVRNKIKGLNKNEFKFIYLLIQKDKYLYKIAVDKSIFKIYFKDKVLNRFLEKFSFFLKEIDISFIKEKDLIKILKIAFDMILIYYKFISLNNISIYTFKKQKHRETFFISSFRILEFVLFVASKKIKKDIFLDDFDFTDEKKYFFYLKDLDEMIKINYFAIFKGKTTKQNRITIGFNQEECNKAEKDNDNEKIIKILKNSFKSSIKTQAFGKNIKESDFNHYFHLDDDKVLKFYLYENVKDIKRGKGGSKKIERRKFITIKDDRIDYISYSTPSDIKNLGDEAKKEIDTKINSIVSPILKKESAEFIESKNLANKKVDINSKFKRYLVSKAISNSIAKSNLTLSKYNIPEIEHLRDFFAFLYKKDKLKADLILLQIVFNSNLEKLIRAFIDEIIFFNVENRQLYVEYGDFFSSFKEEIKIFKRIKKDKIFYIYIDNLLSSILKDFRKNISGVNNLNFSEKIEEIEEELKIFLKISKKEFNKKIGLNLKILPDLSFYYFKKLYKTFSINMLFAKDINKNDQARLCYCATSQRLKSYEDWIKELLEILGIYDVRKFEKSVNVSNYFSTDEKIGSHKIIERGSFKNFLLDLENIYYENIFLEDKINIQMIYLRYVLGLLLATRNFDNSCDLSNYSKKFKILVLQEKAKSIYMSKRIIPLTNKVIEYIEIFNKLKQKYNIHSNFPVLLMNNKEILMTKTKMKDFFTKLKEKLEENNKYINEILYFVEHCELNFGRHLVTYYFANDNVKEDYLDAFLGHFKAGNEDQGIYSYFNNKEYIKVVISKIKEIEKDYLKTDNIFKEEI
jgi:hypothetical protein